MSTRWLISTRLGGLLIALSVAGLACDEYAIQTGAPFAAASNTQTSDDPDGPGITVVGAYQDFGAVISGTQLTHEFELRNTGKSPLEIRSMRTSCGCTAAVMTDRTVAPGEVGRIRVQYTAEGSAPFANNVLVYHNVSADPVRLDIVGTSRYALSGPKEVSLGRLVSGTKRSKVIELTIAEGLDLKITKTGSSLPFITTRAERVGDGVKLTITFDGRPPPQSLLGWVWLDSDREHDDRMVIQIRGVIGGALKAEPRRVYLGTVASGQGATRPVRITAGTGSLDDLEVQVVGPEWITATVEARSNGAEIQVSMAPEAKPGRSTGWVQVRSRGGEWMDIPFNGYVTDHAD